MNGQHAVRTKVADGQVLVACDGDLGHLIARQVVNLGCLARRGDFEVLDGVTICIADNKRVALEVVESDGLGIDTGHCIRQVLQAHVNLASAIGGQVKVDHAIDRGQLNAGGAVGGDDVLQAIHIDQTQQDAIFTTGVVGANFKIFNVVELEANSNGGTICSGIYGGQHHGVVAIETIGPVAT